MLLLLQQSLEGQWSIMANIDRSINADNSSSNKNNNNDNDDVDNNWYIWQATTAEENRTQNSLRAETVNIKGGGGSTQCCLTYWQQKQEYQKGKKEINKRLNKKQCDIRFLKKPSMKVVMHSARLDHHCLRSWGKLRKVLITQAHDFRYQKYDT